MADDSTNPESSSARRGSDNSGGQGGAAGQNSQSQSLTGSALLPDQARRRAGASPNQEGYGACNLPHLADSDVYAGTLSRQTTPLADSTSLRPSRRPPPQRRSTSTHVPHKGQEFSVDDAEDEVGDEMARQIRLDRHPQTASGQARNISTLRRRTTAQVPTLSKLSSAEDEDTEADPGTLGTSSAVEEGMEEPQAAVDGADDNDDDDDGNVSDAESFTLKDRQDAINVTHPFGIRLWKPALYKKSRSVQKTAEEEIHSSPGLYVPRWLLFFNYLWTVLFGWWLGLVSLVGAGFCLVFGILSRDAVEYSRVLWGLSGYLFYPFGKFIKLAQDEAYAAEDEGEGRSISEYEQWQSGDLEEGRLFFGPLGLNRSLVGRRRASSADEHQSLLARTRRGEGEEQDRSPRARLFGRGKWNLGRVVFFLFFYLVITPPLLLVCATCWFLVFSIPMGKVTWLLWDHLRRRPLAMSFHAQNVDGRFPGESPSSILVCTYRAVGTKYWKYTIDGTNIFVFNMLGIVAFTIFDYWVFVEYLELQSFITSPGLIFGLALVAIIPLAYFIGQAVASISAQSSMGVGATVNAFFSTIVEVFLYCVALTQGKAQLVEGSIIGSIFAGILFLPGLSMCFGALKRKTQRFNVKSAGVTSTMLLFAMIGAFGPTLFYQIYGSHELKCHECQYEYSPGDRDCRRCFFSQVPAVNDRFYEDAVLPYIWVSSAALFLSYIIGLFFTLRTHAAIIWTDADEKKTELTNSQVTAQNLLHESPDALTRQPTFGSIITGRPDMTESQLYQRSLGQSLKQTGLTPLDTGKVRIESPPAKSPQMLPKIKDIEIPVLNLQSLSDADNQALNRHVAAIAAAVGRESARARKATHVLSPTTARAERPGVHRTATAAEIDAALHAGAAGAGGHDAPNWSKTKSSVILLSATLMYAVIAEILVNTVDSVLESATIDEKFLGITLFALVPNTTEFLVRSRSGSERSANECRTRYRSR
jgi:Ca2+:H+ antiporter